MFNPVKAVWKAGYKLADGAASRAAKITWPKDITAKEKSWFTGTMGLIIGAGVIGCALQVAAPALVFGFLLTGLGPLAGFGYELLAWGAAASTAALFASGMVVGGDKHCGLSRAVIGGVKALAGGVSKILSPARAPAITQGPLNLPPAPEAALVFPAPAAPSFAKAGAPEAPGAPAATPATPAPSAPSVSKPAQPG